MQGMRNTRTLAGHFYEKHVIFIVFHEQHILHTARQTDGKTKHPAARFRSERLNNGRKLADEIAFVKTNCWQNATKSSLRRLASDWFCRRPISVVDEEPDSCRRMEW